LNFVFLPDIVQCDNNKNHVQAEDNQAINQACSVLVKSQIKEIDSFLHNKKSLRRLSAKNCVPHHLLKVFHHDIKSHRKRCRVVREPTLRLEILDIFVPNVLF